jgi:hypothetical protein
MEDQTSPTDGDIWLLEIESRLYEAAERGHADDVSQLSTHFTGLDAFRISYVKLL